MSMISNSKEEVQLLKPISTKDKQIEHILTLFEEMMRETVKREIKKAVKSYPEKERRNWILSNISQSVLKACSIDWTHAV